MEKQHALQQLEQLQKKLYAMSWTAKRTSWIFSTAARWRSCAAAVTS